MPIAQPMYPARFTPKGLTDAFDATDKFAGACTSLTNLIFDQANPEVVVSRPGVTTIASFAGFNTPAVVSVQITVGARTYGLIGTARFGGKDEPFCYDHTAGAFVSISGVTNANSPTTQATTGAWTPPTMAVIGTRIIVTHPGFSGAVGVFFGVFDISVPATPSWASANTSTNLLVAVPLWVANFNNRAYYGVANTVVFSDVLAPTVVTPATNVLTIGDTSNCLAASGLPIQTTSSGIAQALLVFKAFQVWQITGDLVGSTLALNYLSLTVGCAAPRSIAVSPLGVYFASIGGPYIVNALGVISQVLHSGQETDADIMVPFQNAVTPSRVAGSYSGGIYRLSMDTVSQGASITGDYWFDESRRRWNGPHTFPYDCAAQLENYFVLSSNANPGKLYKSPVRPTLQSVYTDDGVATMATLNSSQFPKTGHMTEKQVVESTLELSSAGGSVAYTVTASDERNNALSVSVIATAQAGSTWGVGVWGTFVWAQTFQAVRPYNVPWTVPLVFKKIALQVIAVASGALSIGTFFARYQDTGYTNRG